MDFKTFREHAYLIYDRIQDKKDKLEEIRERARRCTATWDSPPVKSRGSRVEVLSCEAVELEEQIAQLQKYAADIWGILRQLEDPRHQILVENRYVYGKSWKEVAFKLRRTSDYVKGKLHSQALQELETILDKSA